MYEYLQNVEAAKQHTDRIHALIQSKMIEPNGKVPEETLVEVCQNLLKVLFEVGVIGIKSQDYDGIRWSYENQKWITAEADASPTFIIHKMFWNALGIADPHSSNR